MSSHRANGLAGNTHRGQIQPRSGVPPEGRTISRRPNSRASSEYAPGPRNVIAAAFRLDKLINRQSAWPEVNKLASSNAQAATDTIGVRSPRPKSRLCTTEARSITGVKDELGQWEPVSRMDAAREILRISNATPGAPVGNIEKRRNTLSNY